MAAIRGPYCKVYCQRKRETDKAVLVTVAFDGKDYWFPLSQVSEISMHETVPELSYITCSEWIVGQKDLPVTKLNVAPKLKLADTLNCMDGMTDPEADPDDWYDKDSDPF